MIHLTARQLRIFAHEHDDVPAFHATYIVATFLAAAVLNLGSFLLLIFMHMILDFIKYRDVHEYSFSLTLRAVFLESISDIALFLIGLTVAVYFSHTFMLAAASGLIRSELTILKAVGTLIPKVMILEHMVTIVMSVRSYLNTVVKGLYGSLTRLQVWSIRACISSLFLLAVSVALYAHHEADLVAVLMRELIPGF